MVPKQKIKYVHLVTIYKTFVNIEQMSKMLYTVCKYGGGAGMVICVRRGADLLIARLILRLRTHCLLLQ